MAETVRESIDKALTGRSPVEHWTGQIAAYEREFKKWEERSGRILKRYRDEDREKGKDNAQARFNVLWSNVQTVVPAVYSRVPKPDVSRRFKDNDPIARVAGMILERALEYETQHYPDFRTSMKAAVYDRFLPGRGVVWARYEPHILAVKQKLPTDGSQVTEDIDEPQEQLDYECAPVDYVHWKDFGHTVARSWDEVTAVWRRVYMTREACIERFGEEIGKKIPLDSVPEDLKKGEMGGDAANLSRACVYEIWDKTTQKATWISKSMPGVLDEKDDPLELEGFFPCPKPLYATITNESLVPVPDFALYQDQAKQLDTLADRIQGLIQSLQVKGVYDASVAELARIFTEGDSGTLIPVKNWQAFAEKNGLAGAVELVDLKPIYEALRACYEAMQQVLGQIYDITGISDIVRGQSEASETATAQQIKGQYANLRLKALQTDVAVFASQIIQLKAQIICGNFAPETIMKMAAVDEFLPEDQALVPNAMALLLGPRASDPMAERGDNPLSAFRIEVMSDTLVEIDEAGEKEARMEFLQAQGAFMEKALPMAQAVPQLQPLIMKMWKFSVGAFKVGKSVEGAFDQAISELEQLAKQPRSEKPDPEMAKVQAQVQADQARIASDERIAAQKAQLDAQANQIKAQAEAERHMRELQAKAAEDQRAAMIQQDTELKKTALQVAGQIEVARINAQVTAQQNAQKVEMEQQKNAEESMRAAQESEREAQREEREYMATQSAQQAGADTKAIMQQLLDTQGKLLETLAAPKQVMRDGAGRVIGMQVIK